MIHKFKLIAFIFILLAIPLTVILAQRVQNFINLAAGPDGKLILGLDMPLGNQPYQNIKLQDLDAYARQLGEYPGAFAIWNNWGEYGGVSDGASTAFPPVELLDGLYSRGITPVIFWHPVGNAIHANHPGDDENNPPQAAKHYSNQAIANGEWDPYLQAWGQAAKAYGKPVIVRYAHEMDGKWFPWSVHKAGNGYFNVGNSATNYIAAWRHVHDYVRNTVGAKNVKFLWVPMDTAPAAWYPGNNYVQYVGSDTYSNAAESEYPPSGNPRDPTVYFPEIIKSLRKVVNGTETTPSSKPIIIAETGVSNVYGQAKRNTWLTNTLNLLANDNLYPDVEAVMYFDYGANYALSWYQSPNAILIPKWRELAAQPKFQGRFNGATRIPAPTPTPIVRLPTGYHDASNCNASTGWTCDADNYNSPIDVHFYEGGTFLGAVTANQTRSDLPGAGVCGGNANHGFSFTTPQSLKDGNTHNITAYAINIGAAAGNPVLSNSPKTIQCAPVVNGGWSSWNPPSCPTACGQPATTQTRTCTNPAPSNGGANCSGPSTNTCPATASCPVPTGQLSANPNPCTIPWNGNSCTSTISWNAINTNQVTVKLATGQDIHTGLNGSTTRDWITDNTFILYDTASGTELDRLRVYGVKQPAPVTPTSTPTPKPNDTFLRFASLKLHGIGKGGDNVNPNGTGNNNPLIPTRSLTVELYNASGALVASTVGNISYSSATGDFTGTINLPSTINSGSYLVKIKSSQFLRRQLPGVVNIVKGTTNQGGGASLVTGDINGDQKLTFLDFDILKGCYSDLLPPKNCTPEKKAASDITNDGKVNQDDFSLYIRELSVIAGD